MGVDARLKHILLDAFVRNYFLHLWQQSPNRITSFSKKNLTNHYHRK